MAASKPLLREGYLLKRQRGKSPNADLKKLRFQQRYITLDENILDYFDQKVYFNIIIITPDHLARGESRSHLSLRYRKVLKKAPFQSRESRSSRLFPMKHLGNYFVFR